MGVPLKDNCGPVTVNNETSTVKLGHFCSPMLKIDLWSTYLKKFKQFLASASVTVYWIGGTQGPTCLITTYPNIRIFIPINLWSPSKLLNDCFPREKFASNKRYWLIVFLRLSTSVVVQKWSIITVEVSWSSEIGPLQSYNREVIAPHIIFRFPRKYCPGTWLTDYFALSSMFTPKFSEIAAKSTGWETDIMGYNEDRDGPFWDPNKFGC